MYLTYLYVEYVHVYVYVRVHYRTDCHYLTTKACKIDGVVPVCTDTVQSVCLSVCLHIQKASSGL